MAWNPTSPATLGPEFFGKTGSTTAPDMWTSPVLQRFRSSVGETINNVRFHVASVVGTQQQPFVVEIFNRADEVVTDSAFVALDFAPNVLTVLAGNVNSGPPGTPGTGVVTAIDEWPANYTDRVEMGPSSSFLLEFAAAAYTATGRIVDVMVEVVTEWGNANSTLVERRGTSSDATRRTIVALRNAGVDYGSITKVVPNNNSAGTAGRAVFSFGEINPITNKPWTQADIRAIDTATTRVKIARSGSDTGTWNATAVRLTVVHEPTERRVATGVYLPPGPSATAAWTADVPLFTPAGGAGWVKGNGIDYTLGIRLADIRSLNANAPLKPSFSRVDAVAGSVTPIDHVGLSHTIGGVSLNLPSGFNSAYLFSVGVAPLAPQALVAFVFRTNAAATSADGQPYTTVFNVDINDDSAIAGATQSEITVPNTQQYQGLRMVLGHNPGAPPDQPLNVAVRKRAGGATLGTFQIPPSEVTSDQLLVRVSTTPFNLTAGDQMFLDLATTSQNPYKISFLAVQAGGGGVLYREATFGGLTDEASPILGDAATTLAWTPGELIAVLDEAIAVPGNATIAAGAVAIPSPSVACGNTPCTMQNIPLVSLNWNPTTLGASFRHYEVQRIAPDGFTWQTIGIIPSEATTVFSDTEARIGVVETYHVRVVTIEDTASEWTDPLSATAAVSGTGYTFTSNENPDYNVGYPDFYTSDAIRTYEFPETREITYGRLYGRDYQVAFRSPQDRGVSFERSLMLSALAAPSVGVGPAAAEALRDLARADLAYVCVRDESGNRWFGALGVPSMSVHQPYQAHMVDITFVETTATPTTPSSLLVPPVFTGEELQMIGGTPFLIIGGANLTLV